MMMRFNVAIAAVVFAAPVVMQAQASDSSTTPSAPSTGTAQGQPKGNGATIVIGGGQGINLGQIMGGGLTMTMGGDDDNTGGAATALHTDMSLGLSVASTGSKRDTVGVFVSAVASGGPAERAGIVEGDRIVAIDTVDLHMAGFMASDAGLREKVVSRLRKTMQGLKAGTPVRLRVYSGGRVRTVSVTPDKWDAVHTGDAAADKTIAPIASF